jgi:hypothetical protein
MRYEYNDARLMLNAIKDFLKGPQSFAALDALVLHAALLKNKETLFTPKEIGVTMSDIVEKKYPGYKKAVFIQILCNLLPAKNRTSAINTKFFNIPYNSKKVYLFNEKIGKGTIAERNQKEFFRLLFSFLKVRRELKSRYKELLKEWQDAKHIFTSLSFWERYLGLN